MIVEAFRRLRAAGVLGMNLRNAEYIMRCNPRSAYPLVDNKVMTKRLAKDHGIPTPPLYQVISSHGDIAGLGRSLADRRSFVVKPARGTGGSGIILITDRRAEGYVTQRGDTISRADLDYHISDILSGIYSLEGLEDLAIIEALVFPDPVFSSISYEGVPDIRVVVYRGVPVMGMVRLPTAASEGKANLHRGAIGAGIDISIGKTLNAVHHSSVVTHHPDTNQPVAGIEVPYWEKMLLMASSTLEMTGLCYLGVDLVIDRLQGPLLLELNARPGLGIQLANLAGLRNRLEHVDETRENLFSTARARVAWAMKTFQG